jgi:hypothetical protein
LIRKNQKSKEKEIPLLNFQALFDSVLAKLGLKGDSLSWGQQLIKSVLQVVCKAGNKFFPSGWNFSIKKSLGVKTQEGIFFKAGYCAAVPDLSKLSEVMSSTAKTTITSEGKYVTELKRLNMETRNTQSMFKMALKMVLPFIDPSSEEKLEAQIPHDPLTVTDEQVIEFCKRQPYRACVDALNVSYAKYCGAKNKKLKITPAGFRSSKSYLRTQSRKMKFVTKTGIVYETIQDIPTPILDWAGKKFLFRFPKRKGKKASEPTAQAEESEDSDSDPSDGEMEVDSGVEPPRKQPKIDKPVKADQPITRSNAQRAPRGGGEASRGGRKPKSGRAK